MDNLCHTLTGAVLGEAGLKQRTRFGNAALMIAANVPDVDVIVFATDISPVSFRRGWTHGPVAQLVLPLLLTAIVVLVARWRPGGRDAPPLRPLWVLALAYVGVMSHVALDLLNSYGLRFLAPFDWQWFYGDTLFVIDPWLWGILGVSVWLARRRHVPRPARRGLAVAVAYVALMVAGARVARGMVIDAWETARGTTPRAVMVAPLPVTPFARQVVVDAGDHYEAGRFEWLPPRVTFGPAVVPKNGDDPRVAHARVADPQVRGFLVWSRFPFWTLDEVPGGTRVTLRDMRFTAGAPVRFAVTTLVPDAPADAHRP